VTKPTCRTLPVLSVCLVIALSWPLAGVTSAQEDVEADPLAWPRDLETDTATITIYQPQLESFKNDILEGRSAVQLHFKEEDKRIFGAVWMTARMSTDYDTRMVDLLDLSITAAKIPGIEGEDLERLTAFLEREIPEWEMTISLDRILAGLEVLNQQQGADQGLKHDPPVIYFRTSPTVLVIIDGDPIMQDVEDTRLERVVNTPFFIVKDPSRNALYLKGGDFWYSARDIKEEWKPIANPPDDVLELATRIEAEAKKNAPEDMAEPATDSTLPEITEPPAVILTTVPAELIQTDGDPDMGSVEGTQLLYVDNTESDILLNIDTQDYYVLISGRWYQSKSLTDGPWTHVPPDDVPPEFANIPEGSDMADVLASVVGTEQAKEAVLENQIPQTAEVDRNKTITVEYDGDPKFEAIAGTSMQYAVNSPNSVLLIGGTYYCCTDAVWYRADKATGPWSVATSVPEDVQNIPPESPVYNVKYVYIYETTPEVVYVGYTPGYTGVYYYGGVVVYGTGWWYHPWYHTVYYPRPVTWGFGVHYNPWTGWGFSFGVSYGWLHVGFGGYRGGWWGPAGYRAGYRHGYAHGYHHGRQAGFRAGYRAGQNQPAHRNMYRNKNNVRTAQARSNTRNRTGTTGRPATGQAGKGTAGRTPSKSQKPNNVYSDKQGNSYRKQGDSWQKHDNKSGSWSSSSGSSSGRSSGTAQNRSQNTQKDLNRQSQARDRGNQRSQSYNRSRSGGSRGGGGRRR